MYSFFTKIKSILSFPPASMEQFRYLPGHSLHFAQI